MTEGVSGTYINKMFGVTQEEVDAILEVLRTPKYPLYGEQIARFEKEFAEYVGARHTVAVSSGTAGLHISLVACGVGPGDEVITSSHSFHSVADCVLFVGAKPVFCDIDYDSFNIDPEDARKRMTSKTKALIPVHLNGHPADMDPIMDMASEKGLYVLEDAAHALGAKYKGKMVGTFGQLNMFSFAPGKHVTTMGDGGMITTDDEELAGKVRMLCNHGRGPLFRKVDERGFPASIGNDMLGYNYRISEVHAAIGRVQLRRFIRGEAGPEVRREHVREYEQLLEGTPVKMPAEKEWAYHSYCRLITKAPKRNDLWLFLRGNGLRCGIPYYPPVHLNKTYVDRFGFKKGMLPATEQVTSEILSFPLRRIREDLPQEDTWKLAATIKQFYGQRHRGEDFR